MENINSWNDIRWVTVEEKIFRLQLRIYKAAMNKELEKMYKIQRLLISSKFAKYLSVKRVAQENTGKRTPGVDNKTISTAKEKFALANQLTLNGKRRSLGIPTIEDRAKQMLAYLALCPQWESQFEGSIYGFRPGRSTLDAVEAVFLGISKKPKWVLEANILKCFDKINHNYLLNKCNTFPEMQRQIRAWLKAGILDGGNFTLPEMGTPQGGIIPPLLANIALHGLRESIDIYINSLGGHRPNNRQAFTYVRYADDFVFMHPERKTLENSIAVVQEFLEPIGLKLHPTKTRVVHTLDLLDGTPPGFTFLGFDIVQKKLRIRQRNIKSLRRSKSSQTFMTFIRPSKEGIKRHKQKLREIIRSSRGNSQERLIQKLNPVIRGWALLKRTQISSKIFQALDQYVYKHLWKWARKRHPKMSGYKLKDKYWYKVKKNNWTFGVANKKNKISLQLQKHSKIRIKRYAKVKGLASPFDGNQIYWAKRTGKNPMIPPIKATLIQEQNGYCNICKQPFVPDDIIERDHIIPKALGGKNIRSNVQAVHRYCHQEKTKKEMRQIRRLNRK